MTYTQLPNDNTPPTLCVLLCRTCRCALLIVPNSGADVQEADTGNQGLSEAPRVDIMWLFTSVPCLPASRRSSKMARNTFLAPRLNLSGVSPLRWQKSITNSCFFTYDPILRTTFVGSSGVFWFVVIVMVFMIISSGRFKSMGRLCYCKGPWLVRLYAFLPRVKYNSYIIRCYLYIPTSAIYYILKIVGYANAKE